jgi:hypothetical protein
MIFPFIWIVCLEVMLFCIGDCISMTGGVLSTINVAMKVRWSVLPAWSEAMTVMGLGPGLRVAL